MLENWVDIVATLHLLVSKPRCVGSQIFDRIRPFKTMDGFFNLSMNSILTNVRAKLIKSGSQNSKYSR